MVLDDISGSSAQLFARKLLLISEIDSLHVATEVETIKIISKHGSHPHIVEVLRLGTIDDYQFIDMELCDLNLEEYIHRSEVPGLSKSVPYFVKDGPPPLESSAGMERNAACCKWR